MTQAPPLSFADPTALSLVTEGRFQSTSEVLFWLETMNRERPMKVDLIALDELPEWSFRSGPLSLGHNSGKFFTMRGVRTETDFGNVPIWDQPIICQPEIGILGFLTRVFDGVRYFLIQAKVEPGNINGFQISPTLQATRSNLTRAHRGSTPRYAEYFTGQKPVNVLVDQLQSEQGSRFLNKRNRNMVVEPLEEVPLYDDFCWVTLAQIKTLLQRDNIVNMDARSILSCMPLPRWEMLGCGGLHEFGDSLSISACHDNDGMHTTQELLQWLTWLRSSYERKLSIRGLDELSGWRRTRHEISHESGRYFSVVGVSVESNSREVNRWTQPLVYHSGEGINGLITQRIRGILHFLVRACLYPGNRDHFELGPTVSRSDYLSCAGHPDAPDFLDLFINCDPSWVRYSSIQSEEGGRFYHYQNRYMVLELPTGTIKDIPDHFRWLTLGQIQSLVPHGYFTIEMRNLHACLLLY
jgi:dTDP-4-dehydro-6-deoxy-alpha-D-glucopyranose 2,3-dehydratase